MTDRESSPPRAVTLVLGGVALAGVLIVLLVLGVVSLFLALSREPAMRPDRAGQSVPSPLIIGTNGPVVSGGGGPPGQIADSGAAHLAPREADEVPVE